MLYCARREPGIGDIIDVCEQDVPAELLRESSRHLGSRLLLHPRSPEKLDEAERQQHHHEDAA